MTLDERRLIATSEIEKTQLESAPPASHIAPWHPPPTYPPPNPQATGSTDRRAIASLLAAIAALVLGLPLGIPGMAFGTLAYFLGKSAVSRIDGKEGALGGRGMAVSGSVLGAVAMGIGSAVTLVWLVVILIFTSQPASTAG